MKRRRYLLFVAPAISSLAGCFAGDGSSGADQETLKSVDLSAENVESDSPYASLNVNYAETVSSEIPTDPPTLAEEGMKWLFVKMHVTNIGTSNHEFTGGPFIVRAERDIYEIVSSREDWELRGRTIQPDSTRTGWMVFHIPEEVTEATLTIRDDISMGYSVRFIHDPSLDTTIPE